MTAHCPLNGRKDDDGYADRNRERETVCARTRPAAERFDLTLPALGLLILFFVLPVAILLMRSVTETNAGPRNYANCGLFDLFAHICKHLHRIRPGDVCLIADRFSGRLGARHHAQPRRFGRLRHSAPVHVDQSAGTHLCLDVLLQRTGVINKLLIGMGLIDKPLPLVNNLTGVTIGMTYIMLPFIILPLYGVIRKIDPAILQAAALCGANRWQSLVRVLLPLAMPGMAAGALMVFVMSLGYFVTPALLGGTGHDARRTHCAVRPVSRQLGHGWCRSPCAAGRHAALYAVQLASSAPIGWEGAEMLLNFDRLGWWKLVLLGITLLTTHFCFCRSCLSRRCPSDRRNG